MKSTHTIEWKTLDVDEKEEKKKTVEQRVEENPLEKTMREIEELEEGLELPNF